MKCQACGKESIKKELLYTEDKQPFCINPFTCNEYHPNSVNNIVARGGAVKMFTEDELQTNLFEVLDISDEVKDRITKVATKPQSIRLSKLEIAHYLIQLQETKEMASISEAVRYCVTLAMKVEPIDASALNLPVPEPISEPTEPESLYPKIHLGEGIKIDLRDPISNPIPVEEEEEEELSF